MKTGYGSLSKGSVIVITCWVFLLMLSLVGVCSCWWRIIVLVSRKNVDRRRMEMEKTYFMGW